MGRSSDSSTGPRSSVSDGTDHDRPMEAGITMIHPMMVGNTWEYTVDHRDTKELSPRGFKIQPTSINRVPQHGANLADIQ